jgi:BirA family biotin operon repressor/biotin-[acetyl-CoA-carboxylase] ligase
MRLALLAIPAVRSAIELELARDIEYHERLGSTQDRARELAAGGATPMIVVADEQTAGLGTQGRRWDAPRGTSLLASWLFRPAPGEAGVFVLLAGVAIARALERLGAHDVLLKWPNDVEVGHRKVAGVLAHATADSRGGSLVLGVGVNVHQRPSDFSPALRTTATSLAIAGGTVDRLSLLAALSGELDHLAVAAERSPALAEWRRRATFLGREVEVTRDGAPALRGIARDVAEDGALLVGAERIVAGEVRLVD